MLRQESPRLRVQVPQPPLTQIKTRRIRSNGRSWAIKHQPERLRILSANPGRRIRIPVQAAYLSGKGQHLQMSITWVRIPPRPHNNKRYMRTQFEMKSVFSFTALSVLAIIMMVFWSLVLAWPFQLLWNWLVPGIFGLGRISFIQAFGLKLLLALVFGRMSIEDKRKKE